MSCVIVMLTNPYQIAFLFSLLIGIATCGSVVGQTFTLEISNLPALTDTKAAWLDVNNDGIQDVFLAGVNALGQAQTGVYVNNGNFVFDIISLDGLTDLAIANNDFDLDGFVDLIVSGMDNTGAPRTRLYRNMNGAAFQLQAINFIDVSSGGIIWQDLDLDGDPDLLITGINQSGVEVTSLYERNDDGYVLIDNHGLPDVSNGSLFCADLNNDGFWEVGLTGIGSLGNPVSPVYSFDRNLKAILYTSAITGNAFNAIAVNDYNGDGFDDVIMAGFYGSFLEKQVVLLQNNGLNGFTEVSTDWEGVSSPAVLMSDLDNDGWADVLVGGNNEDGYKTLHYFRNSEAGIFISRNHPMPTFDHGSLALADAQGDGGLDLLQSGNMDIEFQTNFFALANEAPNQPPSIPTNLTAIAEDDSVFLSWEGSADDHTSAASLQYSLYVSKESGGELLVVSPIAAIPSGQSRLPGRSNVGHATSKFLKGLPEGEYYWAVQALDNGGMTSAFSAEGTFTICHQVSLGEDVAVCSGELVQLQAGSAVDEVSWIRKGGEFLQENSNVLELSIQHNDTIVASVLKPLNCIVRDTVVVRMNALPVIDLGADMFVCMGETFSINLNVENVQVQWYRNRIPLQLGGFFWSEVVTQRDTVVARVTDDNDCVQRDTLVVDVWPLPSFDLGPDRAVCPLESTTFTMNKPEITFNWFSVSTGLLASNSQDLTRQVFARDTLVAEAISEHGCLNRDSVIVDVWSLPLIDLGDDQAVCLHESAMVVAAGVWSTIQWQNQQGETLAVNAQELVHPVQQTDTIIATVFNIHGCVNRDSVKISALNLPQVDLGDDRALCEKDSALLETGTGFKRVDWISKRASQFLATDTWFLKYKPTSTDTIVAMVENLEGCLGYDTLVVKVSPLPVFSLGDDQSICAGHDITLMVPGSWGEVRWYTYDDVELSDESVFRMTVQDSLTVWSRVISNAGCVSLDTVRVNALPLPLFEWQGEVEACETDTVRVASPRDAVAYEWRNGFNELISTSNEIQWIAAEPISFHLTLRNEWGCAWQDSLALNVHPLPVVEIIGAQQICNEESARFEVQLEETEDARWEQSIGEIQTQEESFILVTANESGEVTATITNEYGCRSSDHLSVTVQPRPLANAGTDQQLCFGETAVLGDGESFASTSYRWSPPSGLSDPFIHHPVTSIDHSVEYELLVTNEFGCYQRDSVLVEANPKIVVDAGADMGVCVGESVVLGGNPTASGSKFGYSYEWQTDQQVLQDQSPNPTVAPLASTTYYLLVASGRCSLEMDSVRVTVHPLPTISVSPRQSIGHSESRKLFASGGSHFAWSPVETLDDPALGEPTVSPLKTTSYSVVVTDDHGCQEKGTVEVLVQDQLFVPTLFTPNADGANDFFRLYGSGIESVELSVFDLNGNRVFFSNSVEECLAAGWDGTTDGRLAPPGTYIWQVKGHFFSGERLVDGQGLFKGFLNLTR